jgi:N-acetylglucosamine malate deacetylase 1
MKKRIMVAMAHADDMEYYAGGTVAKFVAQGYKGILLMLSNNICGADLPTGGKYLEHPPEETTPVRDAEARAGADILGVKTIEKIGFKDNLYWTGERVAWIGDKDFDMHHPGGLEPMAAAPQNKRCITRVAEAIAKYEPEIVIAHNFTSGFEHTCAAHLVNQAFGQAVAAGASLGSLWIPAHVRHCAWQSDVRMFPSPDVLIDISDHWPTKLAAIRAHKSQHVEGTLEKVELINRYWGLARQCKYAEPFFTVIDARYQ